MADPGGGDDQPPAAMSSPHRDRASRWNVVHLDDHRAPDVDDMLDRVTEEAHRQDGLHAARDLPGMSEGERRRLPGKDAGEENQEPDDWDGA